jgi:hypothetical protein
MKRGWVAVVCVALFGGLCAADDGRVLHRLSLDDRSSLALEIANDSAEKIEGAASLKITTGRPTTVCIGEATGLNVEAARLIFAARVKTDLEGAAFLEMWVQVGEGNYFSKGLNDTIKGKTDWKTIQTPFFLQKGQRANKATLNLVINGKGTIWIDDAALTQAALK